MNEATLKYEFTDITQDYWGTTLYRIRALKDFADVKKGDLGGWVENEDNLNQKGSCWIYGEAKVLDEGRILDHANIGDYATVRDNAIVCNNAIVFGFASLNAHVVVCNDAMVGGDIYLSGKTHISQDGYITSNEDYFSISNLGSRNATITFYLTKHKEIMVKTGCFTGTIDEFKEAVQNTHKGNKHGRSYNMAIILALHQLKGE